MTPQTHSARLDRMFHALADRSRRSMVDHLSRGPASVSELARPIDMALPSALKHLTVLEAGGVVTSEKVGRVRTYALAPAALSLLDAWVAERKAVLGAQLDRLERYLVQQAGDDAGDKP